MKYKLESEDIVNDGAATRAPVFPLEAAVHRFSAECSEKLAGLKSRLTTDLARRFNNLNGQLRAQLHSPRWCCQLSLKKRFAARLSGLRASG